MNLDSAELHKIFAEAMALMRDAQVTRIDWKKRSKLLIALCAIFGLATLCTAGYFIVTHRIGPLMLDVAVAVLILCMALYQQVQHTSLVEKEFLEYRDAVTTMVEYLQVHLEENVMDETLLELIRNAQKEGNDLSALFEALSHQDEESLNQLIGLVVDVTQANIIHVTNAHKDPDAPDEDLSVRA